MSLIITSSLQLIYYIIWLVLRWTHLIYTHLTLTFQRLTYLLEVSNNYHNTDTITEDLAPIQKIPQHLAVILDSNPTFGYNLAKLANWCIISKIPKLTLYLNQKEIDFTLKNLSDCREKVQKPYYSLGTFEVKQEDNNKFYYFDNEDNLSKSIQTLIIFLLIFILVLSIKLICLRDTQIELSSVINKLIEDKVTDLKADAQSEAIHKALQEEGLLSGPNLIIAPKNPFTFRNFSPLALKSAEIR
jgi:hypothetical protein